MGSSILLTKNEISKCKTTADVAKWAKEHRFVESVGLGLVIYYPPNLLKPSTDTVARLRKGLPKDGTARFAKDMDEESRSALKSVLGTAQMSEANRAIALSNPELQACVVPNLEVKLQLGARSVHIPAPAGIRDAIWKASIATRSDDAKSVKSAFDDAETSQDLCIWLPASVDGPKRIETTLHCSQFLMNLLARETEKLWKAELDKAKGRLAEMFDDPSFRNQMGSDLVRDYRGLGFISADDASNFATNAQWSIDANRSTLMLGISIPLPADSPGNIATYKWDLRIVGRG